MDPMIISNKVYSPPKYGQHVLKPVQVHVFFRHGDRTPTPIYKAALDKGLWASRLQEISADIPVRTDYEHQVHPWGQLTKKGKEQALQLGQWLQQVYLEPLKIFEDLPSRVQFRSTNYQRTHMTGLYVLEGLLGSKEVAESIPVIIRAKERENLGENGSHASVSFLVKAHMDEAMKSVLQPDGTFRPSETNILLEKVKVGIGHYLGLPSDNVLNWFTMILVADALYCGKMHGDLLPELVAEKDLYALRDSVGNEIMAVFKDKVPMRMGIGRLTREIAESISHRAEESPDELPALQLYSGHDTTLMPLSAALGAPLKDWPGYCANIIIELLRSAGPSKEFFVRVLYDGDAVPLTLFSSSSHEAKVVLTLEEFLQQLAYSSISEEEFQLFCSGMGNVDRYEKLRTEDA